MTWHRASSKIGIWLPLFFLATLFIGSSTFGEILFEEDFEGEALDPGKWLEPIPAVWTLREPKNPMPDGKNGAQVLDSTGGAIGVTVERGWVDYEIEVDVFPVTIASAVFFRAQDAGNGYFYNLFPSGPSIGWVDWANNDVGDFAEFVAELPGLEFEKWYHVHIVVQGDTFDLYIDGEKVTTQTDGAYKKGGVGFRTAGNESGQYDNLVVYTIGSTPACVSSRNKLTVTWGEIKMEY